MANTKISALSSASLPLSGSEIVPLVQAGVDSQFVANILNASGGSQLTFQNLAAVEAATVPASVQNIICLSSNNPGDLLGFAMPFVRCGGNPYSVFSESLTGSGLSIFKDTYLGTSFRFLTPLVSASYSVQVTIQVGRRDGGRKFG